jgi:hypothetical protein
MWRRDFMKIGVLGAATAYIPPHNFDKYDFGSGPAVQNRLNQGPFPSDVYPSWSVVMALTPSTEVVPNYGMGLVAYLCDEVGLQKAAGQTEETALEELAKFPLGTKLYVRVNWKDVQSRPGRLEPNEIWKSSFALGPKYGKRISFCIMIGNPDILGYAVPDFVRAKVPMKLGAWQNRVREEPRCDDPHFQSAFQELIGLLAAEYDGNADVESVDTCMYGFWGEGHEWQSAERKRTPLVTNTQPDFSKVGNSELVDRTIRSGNWLRTDTIFIENEQIEALSNRPAWTAAAVEVGISDGAAKSLHEDEGVTYSDNVVWHAHDVGANYFSLWNSHRISVEGLKRYYAAYPKALDRLARSIGYRVRPSWIWTYEERGAPGLIIGFVNDGIAGVPGVLRVSVESDAGQVLCSGALDAGHPLPGRVRQAQFPLPKGTKRQGLRLKAELEVKGQRNPVRRACQQKLNPDGGLTLRFTNGLSVSDVTGGLEG